MSYRTPKSGPRKDPLEWVIGALLDLLEGAILKALDKPVEALIKRLPHR